VPTSLPAALFLLAHHPQRQRLTAGRRTGVLLRAAALAELTARGHLEDASGKARVRDPGRPADPVLAGVLDEIVGSRPRSWQHWVRRHRRSTWHAVRDQLCGAGVITVQAGPLGGRVEVSQLDALAALHARADEVLRGREPVDQIDQRDAAIVALAAAGELRTVVPRRAGRRYRTRIRELTERAGAAVPALRRVLRATRLLVVVAGANAGQGG
jgi:hypothetical protein